MNPAVTASREKHKRHKEIAERVVSLLRTERLLVWEAKEVLRMALERIELEPLSEAEKAD